MKLHAFIMRSSNFETSCIIEILKLLIFRVSFKMQMSHDPNRIRHTAAWAIGQLPTNLEGITQYRCIDGEAIRLGEARASSELKN